MCVCLFMCLHVYILCPLYALPTHICTMSISFFYVFFDNCISENAYAFIQGHAVSKSVHLGCMHTHAHIYPVLEVVVEGIHFLTFFFIHDFGKMCGYVCACHC
jgi:hypothetical protein